MINALLSLTAFYELPLALFVSRRGVYKEKIEAQLPMGQRLPAILSAAGIGSTQINSPEDLKKVEQELPEVYSKGRIHAFLMSPAVWEGSECGVGSSGFGEKHARSAQPVSCIVHSGSPPALTRYDIIKLIAPYLEGKVVVSNLGWPSKELYAVKHQPSNFYMLGSMGMATPIGLGIALTSKKEVIVIDGDGSLLMNPGSLATAASLAPKNLIVIAIDNGVYGSTGNQPTLAGTCADLEQVALGFGFRNSAKVAGEDEITAVMKNKKEGVTFLHVLAIPGNKDVPNIPVHHLETKQQVQAFLKT
jgi:sulfopyruvate decarboxylase subunit beta